MSIWDYGVRYVYGYSKDYGPKFHRGEDRPAPKGTPVTVNGVTIGLVGTTGYSTGYHLHVGKWGGGGHYPPNGGGATLPNAKVTEIDTSGKTDSGKFVRVQSGSHSWVYLHLDKVLVKVGQTLEGGDMATATDVKYIYRYGPLKRTADANGVKHYTGKSVKFIVKDHLASGEYKKMIAKKAKAEEAEAKAEAAQVKSIKDLTKALANQKNKKPEVVIKEVQKIVTKIQKVQVIKEVVKEVPAEINEQEVVQGFFSRLWNNLFKGSK